MLSLTNVGLNDRTALLLADAIEKTKTLRVLNVETNFISPPVIVTLVKALLKAKSVEEFRATNQVGVTHLVDSPWRQLKTMFLFLFARAEIVGAGKQNRNGNHRTGGKERITAAVRITFGIQ